MKIQAYERRTEQLGKWYAVSKLKDDSPVRESFKVELKNRFQVLTDMKNVENETIEEKWRKFRIASTEASDNVLDFKENDKKEIWEKIRERKNANLLAPELFFF